MLLGAYKECVCSDCSGICRKRSEDKYTVRRIKELGVEIKQRGAQTLLKVNMRVLSVIQTGKGTGAVTK